MEEMNKIWVVFNGKTYESFSWLKNFYTHIKWPNHSALQGLSGPFLEGICRDLFKTEKNPERRLAYTTFDECKSLQPMKRKKLF